MGNILFFGYGANRNAKRLQEILGKTPEGGRSAMLKNFDLAYQILDQIPEMPRQILGKIWGESFKAYTLRAGHGYVVGKVWEITEADLEKLKKWEFVSENWREIIPVEVTTYAGETLTVYTEKALDQLPIKEKVDGLVYEENLNSSIKPELLETENEYRIQEIRQELYSFYGQTI